MATSGFFPAAQIIRMNHLRDLLSRMFALILPRLALQVALIVFWSFAIPNVNADYAIPRRPEYFLVPGWLGRRWRYPHFLQTYYYDSPTSPRRFGGRLRHY